MTYDSKPDTLDHIVRVQHFMSEAVENLLNRALVHDQSKLEEPEKSVLDRVTPKLRELTYGSDEYKASLAEMGDALQHHYRVNRHHPEHWSGGIYNMSLLDLIEMFCDSKAATERHADGDIMRSIDHNAGRFDLTDLLANIFRNTARELGWTAQPPGSENNNE